MEKYDWASWEKPDMRPSFAIEVCGVCAKQATHIAIAENTGADGDVKCIRSRCDEHFNLMTQKTWLKAWRKKNCKI